MREMNGREDRKPVPDAAQREAILHKDGPCLVIAGPGAGKTSVLTARIDTLIRKYGVPPSEILVITFTRTAAREMKERFLKRDPEQGNAVSFGTFHSVFFQILRQRYHYEASGILREGEKRRMMQEVLTRLLPDEVPDSSLVRVLLAEYSAMKNRGGTVPDGDERIGGLRMSMLKLDIGRVFSAYDIAKRHSGKLDFDDMLTLTEQLLRSERDTLAYWRRRFRYILVDEFQDINPVQYRIVRMLAAPAYHLFAVGDDDQSIYSFRGARPELMLGFPKDCPGTRQILLTVNYRSGREIVDAAARLIRRNEKRYVKRFRTAASKAEDPAAVLHHCFKNAEEEAAGIAHEIEREVEQGAAYADFAVLLRTNAGASALAAALSSRKIPYYSAEKLQVRFREAFLEPLYAMLNWASGSHSMQNFLRFMNCPSRGISRRDAEDCGADPDALAALYRKNEAKRFLVPKIQLLSQQLKLLAGLQLPYAMINYARKGMGYDRYLLQYAKRSGRDPGELMQILDEVQASAAPMHVLSEWYAFIAEFTENADKAAAEEERRLSGREAGGGRVRIGTIHGAKGLEFDTVFIPLINERILPHEKALTQDAVEEERRILYVGMTRAIRKLRLSSVRELYGREAEPSRFLKEIGIRG